MLCLECDTRSGWVEAALQNLDSIIADHAHCEKKAASTGMSLISAYPENTGLLLAMSDLVEEEIGHFRSVVQIMQARGIPLGKDQTDDYVQALFANMHKNEPARFLDRLLVAGIIEARSCERLRLLAAALNDESLAGFYKGLADTEAGHYVTFVKLAKQAYPEEQVKNR
ncbi:MAG: tRNA-(ms[2]io[6]A)-hydroxylase, partial [Ignavibacteriales bacterium]|nr:tRNA-(ms[2]io[6]A)-hydroxylase [Ignavibacteriales bacterium]